MILHTVNQSPFQHRALQQCLRLISPPAALLLIEDGVYAATTAYADTLAQLPSAITLYALQQDVAARGVGGTLNPRIKQLSDQEFVELSIRCTAMQAWY